MPKQRFIQNLSESIKKQLIDIYKSHPDFPYRQRAHAILLSHRGYTINQLQDIFDVDRDTISHWLNRFERSGLEGLKNEPRAGRPAIFSDDEIHQFKALIDQEPRQLKQAHHTLQETTGKASSTATLKRILKKNSTIHGTGAVDH